MYIGTPLPCLIPWRVGIADRVNSMESRRLELESLRFLRPFIIWRTASNKIHYLIINIDQYNSRCPWEDVSLCLSPSKGGSRKREKICSMQKLYYLEATWFQRIHYDGRRGTWKHLLRVFWEVDFHHLFCLQLVWSYLFSLWSFGPNLVRRS